MRETTPLYGVLESRGAAVDEPFGVLEAVDEPFGDPDFISGPCEDGG